jgi:hypothetical protein
MPGQSPDAKWVYCAKPRNVYRRVNTKAQSLRQEHKKVQDFKAPLLCVSSTMGPSNLSSSTNQNIIIRNARTNESEDSSHDHVQVCTEYAVPHPQKDSLVARRFMVLRRGTDIIVGFIGVYHNGLYRGNSNLNTPWFALSTDQG